MRIYKKNGRYIVDGEGDKLTKPIRSGLVNMDFENWDYEGDVTYEIPKKVANEG